METPGHQQLPRGLQNNSWQILVSKSKDCISYNLLEHYYRQNLRIGYLWSWTVDMQTIFQNIQVTLEEPWYHWNLCMEWLTTKKLFSDEFTEWLIEAVFIQFQCHMSIFYKYAPYGTNIVVISYGDYFVHWFTSEDIGKWFVGTLWKIFHVKFLGYAHWFMSIRISYMNNHSISVDHSRYAISIVAKYLDNTTVNTSKKFYKTNLISDMILTNDDVSTSDE